MCVSVGVSQPLLLRPLDLFQATLTGDTLHLMANCFDWQLPHSCNSKHTVAASESYIFALSISFYWMTRYIMHFLSFLCTKSYVKFAITECDLWSPCCRSLQLHTTQSGQSTFEPCYDKTTLKSFVIPKEGLAGMTLTIGLYSVVFTDYILQTVSY